MPARIKPDDPRRRPTDARKLALRLRKFALRGARRNLATRRTLLDWARCYLPRHFALPSSRMHQWMAGQLERATSDRGSKLNVIGPRGSAKSTLVSLAYVLRAAVEGTERYIWIVSDTRHQAAVHLENIRVELEENRRLRADYSAAFQRPPQTRGSVLRLANGVIIEAWGTGQRIRGKRRREHRPTLIVCDDLQNDDHISSSYQRDRSRQWFQGTLLKAGTKRTNFVNVATALHRDALAVELTRTAGWNSATFRAIEHWPTSMTLWQAWEQIYTRLEDPQHVQAARAFYESHRAAMDEGAVLLWPEEEDLYTLMRMRVDGGRVAFEREKQGSPFDPGLCEWPESYFNEAVWFDDWPTGLAVRVLALDPSKGAESRRGDYSAYVLLGLGDAGEMYVEADLARRATPQMVADGVELFERFRPDALAIEANQFQELLGSEFVRALQARGHSAVRPWLIDNRVNKRVRIRRLGPLLAARQLRFKRNSPGTSLLVEQLQTFPIGDHDDGPDALEMAIRMAGELTAAVPNDGLGDRLPM
jgi:predicted phage terminase large subunit-like protein